MTVVVGVDGSPSSYPAIRLAFQEARYRGTTLVAVMAYGGEAALGATPIRPAATLNPAEQRERTESTLDQVVRDALAEEAADVEKRVVQGGPGHGLVEAARQTHAQMVVLSARTDGAVSRLLGPVSQHVLRNAPCPVLVVPSES